MRRQLRSVFLVVLLCGSFTAAAQDFGFGTPNGPRKSTFANLAAVTNGAARYCTDCTATAPCAGSGTGAFAYRVGSAWNCNIGSPASSGSFVALDGTTTGATSQAQPFTNGITLGSSSVTGVLNLYVSGALSPVVVGVSTALPGPLSLDPLATPSGSGNALLDTNPIVNGSLTVPQTGGIVGTTTNNNASAGSFGEFKTAVCPGPTTTATITVTIATPAVVTWTAHPFSGTAPRFDACPVVFTTSSSLPTGITAGTNYWVVPASISGNNFSIATSVANAIAGTKVATSGSQAGTQTGTAGTALSTGAAKDITGLALTAGDWDCSGATDFQFGATTSITNLVGSISTTAATLGGQDTGFDYETPAAIPTATADMTWRLSDVRQLLGGTTNVFSVAQGTFTASTLKTYGTIRCRRMR